ncbi:NAD(P)/FAD-dependent oxidoreductase [Micromonospora endophytica]|uniref:bifunctional NAD(P)/FAD-dependent oxidoreductase/class I SAM-dependent methyltransferase n=1 Tax=Micromonospora endophytica TaxID=515350 RepID=UPI000E67E18C|nr:bifunctional NAD(P)/FAD-dependent oxidoreductase/class I SAM-dependent methyltransferase [Micromonospora endophytica]RIW49525.1 NAD(P)/FAD-dependent oxidoreductase [Micromonospora endophytica]
MDDRYDVVVVGGGAAGLAGALALARARRSVLVVDAGEPRNAPAAGVHHYLGREGTPPAQLTAAGREEVRAHGGQVVAGRVDGVTRDGDGFVVTVDGTRTVRARRLLVTTGLVDELPDVPGLTERWGRDVLHCPYCHGWEVRDQRIGVLATGPFAVQQALLWRQWSPQVLVLLHDAAVLDAAQTERLAARGVPVVSGPVAAVELAGDQLTGVRLADGELVELDAVVVVTRMVARSVLLESLGLSPVDVEMSGHVIGRRVPADATGATAVPGVWVAGNVTDVSAQVIRAAGAGTTAGAAINADLVEEDTDAAVTAYREQRETMFTEAAWEQRYQARDAVWSGRPNPQLVAEVEGSAPGRVLDVGCGEGADAVWLAERGWQVTAVDISDTALTRAAAYARERRVAERIEFRHADLMRWTPEPDGYDLVSAQFMQLPPQPRRDLFGRLAAAVAPGGRLLIVGHHPRDLRSSAHRLHLPEMMFTAEQVAAELDAQRFEVLAAQTRPRTTVDPHGQQHTIHDAVLLARRR